jgi:hypothetical protein
LADTPVIYLKPACPATLGSSSGAMALGVAQVAQV